MWQLELYRVLPVFNVCNETIVVVCIYHLPVLQHWFALCVAMAVAMAAVQGQGYGDRDDGMT